VRGNELQNQRMPDSIAGLPLHPLVVHLPLVLLPLSAIGLLLVLLIPRSRRTYGWLPVLGLAISAIAALAAKVSGENLSEVLGRPQEHAEWGDRLVPLAAVLFVVAALWYWRIRSAKTGAVTGVLAVVAGILSVVSIGVVIAVGHSGAEAAWAGKYAAASGVDDTAMEVEVEPETEASGAASDAAPITMDEVAQHALADDCWTTINGNVYDLTYWIGQHPGGPQVIEALCGADGTEAFNGKHGGAGLPASELKSFLLGPLQ
jgi:cytochrome b involved in lipid metabolism